MGEISLLGDRKRGGGRKQQGTKRKETINPSKKEVIESKNNTTSRRTETKRMRVGWILSCYSPSASFTFLCSLLYCFYILYMYFFVSLYLSLSLSLFSGLSQTAQNTQTGPNSKNLEKPPLEVNTSACIYIYIYIYIWRTPHFMGRFNAKMLLLPQFYSKKRPKFTATQKKFVFLFSSFLSFCLFLPYFSFFLCLYKSQSLKFPHQLRCAAKISIYIYIYIYDMYVYIYIHIHVVGSISGPHFTLCWVSMWSTFSFFVFFFFFRQGEGDFWKKRKLQKKPN